jgi:peptidoglycan hydrolase CwlO-like protein
VGSLVNDPAFEDIPRIAASNQLQHSDMEHLVNLGLISPETKEEDALVEAEATVKGLKDEVVKAELSLQEATEQIKVESASTEKELADLKIRHDKLTEDHDALLAKMDAGAEASASAAVEDAVTSGRIAPKDEAAKTFWKESIIAKPESARVLASMTANPVLSGETILAGRSVGREIEKEMNRCDFDALTPGERLSYVQAGGTIQDDAS